MFFCKGEKSWLIQSYKHFKKYTQTLSDPKPPKKKGFIVHGSSIADSTKTQWSAHCKAFPVCKQ